METKNIKVTISMDMLQRARDYVERCRNQVIVDEDIELMINGRVIGGVKFIQFYDGEIKAPEPIDTTKICTSCWKEVIEYGNRLCTKCKEGC